jgi:hypothetical protein
MKSWASVVKANSNPPASTQSKQTVPAAPAAAAARPREDDIFTLKTMKTTKPKGRVGGGGQPVSAVAPAEPISEKQQSTESIASTSSAPLYQCITPSEDSRPSHKTLIRPGAPIVAPIFKNETEKREWEDKEYQENRKYSNEIHHQEMEKWRAEKRWHNVLNMTSMTKEEEAAGFIKVYKSYITLDQERRLLERCPGFIPPSDYGYLVPCNSTQKSDVFWDFMGRLFHNRADELCRCKTVEDFEKVYNEAAELEWLDWEWKIRQEFPAKDALWTMSIKANMWPNMSMAMGMGRTANPKDEDDVPPPKYKLYVAKRGETDICSVKDIKTLGKKAPIRWHVSPTYLKNMKRFQFIYEENPKAYYFDSDDECFYERRPVFSDDE